MPNRNQMTVALVFKAPMTTHAFHLIEALAGLRSSDCIDAAECHACAEAGPPASSEHWDLGHWYPLYVPDQDDQARAAAIRDAAPAYWIYVFDDEEASETMDLLSALAGYAVQGAPVFVQREDGLPEVLFVGGSPEAVSAAMHRYYAQQWQTRIGEQGSADEMMLRSELAELVTNLGAESPLVTEGDFGDIGEVRERADAAGQLIY